jgi:hypothetical protein
MNKIQSYHFGYVLEKVNYVEEVLEIIETPYAALNIFGQILNQKRVHRVNFCRFTPGEAISMPYKNKKDCEDFQKLYENS